jgi:hypothetical protein
MDEESRQEGGSACMAMLLITGAWYLMIRVLAQSAIAMHIDL